MENIEAVKKSHFYSSSLDVKRTYEFLNKKSYVFQEALKDFPQTNHSSIENCLKYLISNVSEWMVRKEFYDRELILKNKSTAEQLQA
jgi:hypothetical protein